MARAIRAARAMQAARPPSADELAALQARLEMLLDPYRDRLEAATIYGMPTLRRPGGRAHDWFAFVNPATRHVSLFLLPIVTWPDLLDGCSPTLAARLTGRSTFSFRSLDAGEQAELVALLARAFDRYMAAG